MPIIWIKYYPPPGLLVNKYAHPTIPFTSLRLVLFTARVGAKSRLFCRYGFMSRRLLFQPLQLFDSSSFKHLRLRHHLTPLARQLGVNALISRTKAVPGLFESVGFPAGSE
jgi:hypothetical protein